MELVSRKFAKEKGLTKYFTGKPCKYGHICEHRTKTANCIECDKIRPRRECTKTYYIRNKEKCRKINKEDYEKNKDHYIKLAYKRQIERTASDPLYKLARNLRARFKTAISKNYKSGSAVRDLGCSIEELKIYLESKFLPGMTWDNYGLKGWHIDHIKPLSSFDLTDRDQFLKCFNYTNLQPLWAFDNISKGCKWDNLKS